MEELEEGESEIGEDPPDWRELGTCVWDKKRTRGTLLKRNQRMGGMGCRLSRKRATMARHAKYEKWHKIIPKFGRYFKRRHAHVCRNWWKGEMRKPEDILVEYTPKQVHYQTRAKDRRRLASAWWWRLEGKESPPLPTPRSSLVPYREGVASIHAEECSSIYFEQLVPLFQADVATIVFGYLYNPRLLL